MADDGEQKVNERRRKVWREDLGREVERVDRLSPCEVCGRHFWKLAELIDGDRHYPMSGTLNVCGDCHGVPGIVRSIVNECAERPRGLVGTAAANA